MEFVYVEDPGTIPLFVWGSKLFLCNLVQYLRVISDFDQSCERGFQGIGKGAGI